MPSLPATFNPGDLYTNTNVNQVAQFINGLTGVILPFGGTAATVPTGWLLCYGQAISRTVYAALFAVLGTTYGAGDGSTSFNLPDLRGRAVAGVDNMGGTAAGRLTGATGSVAGTTLGATGGEETHNLSATEMPSHTHAVTTNTTVNTSINVGYGSGGLGAGYGSTGSGNSPANVCGASSGAFSSSTAANNAGGARHYDDQPAMVLNSIICT